MITECFVAVKTIPSIEFLRCSWPEDRI